MDLLTLFFSQRVPLPAHFLPFGIVPGTDEFNALVAGTTLPELRAKFKMLEGMKPRALVAYWGYGDVDGDWYTKPSEHYRKQPLVSKEEAFTACQALADAGRILVRSGGLDEADSLGTLFDLLEERLVAI